MPRAVTATGLPGSQPFPEEIGTLGANIAKTAFRHTVTVRRNTAAGTDTWGNPVPPTFTNHLAGISCLAFVRPARTGHSREITDGQKTATIEERVVLLEPGTDVTPADQLTDVTDAATNIVFAGPLRIESVAHRASYLELVVEAIS